MKTPINRLFHAFADPNRLRILNLLKKGEMCVCDLISVLGLGQSLVSRHLSHLRRAGLVATRREGPWIHYSLAAPAGRTHRRLIDCLGGCFSEVPELRSDLARLKKRGSRGC